MSIYILDAKPQLLIGGTELPTIRRKKIAAAATIKRGFMCCRAAFITAWAWPPSKRKNVTSGLPNSKFILLTGVNNFSLHPFNLLRVSKLKKMPGLHEYQETFHM